MTETEKLAFLVRICPSVALRLYADKLTPEQFNYCMHKDPSTAIQYCSDRLTKEQLDSCEDRTK